jgi:preprotein translocase SecE subunit
VADTSHDEPDTPGDAELERAALAGTPARAAGPVPGTPTAKGPARFAVFLRASWAELQRVQWPDRAQVGQATAVVIGFVIIAGAYLGLADAVAKKVVDIIL